ncbi:MAG: transcription termination/antitermination protein NusG [Nitrosotalea sp.]
MEDPVLELGGKFLTNPGGASPAEVSSDFLDGIKNLETQTDMEKVVEQTFDLTIGDRVEITNGPFLSGSGVITQIKKGKVLVELEIMKRFVEVEFEPQQCFKIK